MTRLAALLLIVVFAVSSIIVVKSASASASIPKPSVPEFTVKFVDHSYDVPTTQSIDPYTGETVTHPAHRVENRTIEVTIKNQPFASKLMYNIRVKGHFSEYWTNLYSPSDGFLIQSDSEYTVATFTSSGGDDFYGSHTPSIHAPVGGQVDFQVEALHGYVHREITIPVPGTGWLFTGETSGWSETKTITIPASTSSPTDSPPDQTLTPTPDQETQQTEPFPTLLVIAVIVTVVAVVGVGLLVYFKERNTKSEVRK